MFDLAKHAYEFLMQLAYLPHVDYDLSKVFRIFGLSNCNCDVTMSEVKLATLILKHFGNFSFLFMATGK